MRWPFVLLAGVLLCCPGTGTENASTAQQQAPQGDKPAAVTPGVDPELAQRAQRHNLRLLFQRYGHSNQSLTVEGFRRLLSNLMERRESGTGEHTGHGHGHHPHHQHHTEPAAACQHKRARRHVTTPAPEGPAHGAISPPGAPVEVITHRRVTALTHHIRLRRHRCCCHPA